MAQLDAIAAALQAAGPMVAAGFGKPKSRYQDQIDYGNALMKTGASTAPVSGWVEGIARALQGPLGGYFRSEASDEQQASDAAQRDELTSAFATQDFEKVAKALANIPGQEGAAATLMLGRLGQNNQNQQTRTVVTSAGGLPGVSGALPGVSPPGSYNDATSRRESGNDPRALNPQSGAAGLYQFMPQTWASARAAIPGLPADPRDATPEQQTAATNWLTETNRGVLRTQLGREPTQGELGLAHAVGAGGARAYLALPPDTPVEALPQDFWQRLGEQYTHATYLAQNPQVRGKTIGQIIGEFRSQYERQPVSGAPPAPGATPIQYAPNQSRPMSPADIAQNGWQPIPQAGPDQGTWGPQAGPVAPPQAVPRPGSVPQRPTPPAPVAPPPAIVSPPQAPPRLPGVATSPPQAPAVGQELDGAGAPPGADPRPSYRTQPGFTGQPAPRPDADPGAAYEAAHKGLLQHYLVTKDPAAYKAAMDMYDKMTAARSAAVEAQNKRTFNPPPNYLGADGTVQPMPGQFDYMTGAAQATGGTWSPDPSRPGYLINSVTGDVKPIPAPPNITLDAQGRPTASPDTLKALRDIAAAQADPSKPPTEGQAKAATRAERMAYVTEILKQYDTQGTSRVDRIMAGVPYDAANGMKSADYQVFETAGRVWLSNVLRGESGGAITDDEWTQYRPIFFPIPGDSEKNIALKRELRAAYQRTEAAPHQPGFKPGEVPAVPPLSAPAPGAPASGGRVLKWTPDGGLR